MTSWVTRPHNYARMQVVLLMYRLPYCISAKPGPSCLDHVKGSITVTRASAAKQPQHVHWQTPAAATCIALVYTIKSTLCAAYDTILLH